MAQGDLRNAILVGYAVAVLLGLGVVLACSLITWAFFGPAVAAGVVVVAAGTAGWFLWARGIRWWRRWAETRGIPAAQLHRMGVASGLVGPHGSRIQEAERSAAVPLMWGLIVGGVVTCISLQLELRGQSRTLVHLLESIGYLSIAIGIAWDALMSDGPRGIAWLGVGCMLLGTALGWMFFGTGLNVWLWVLLKAGPPVTGVLAVVYLALKPNRVSRALPGARI